MFGSVAGPGENSTRTPPAFGKSQQLCSWAKMAADNLGAGCGRAVPGPPWPLPRCPALRAAHMRSASLHIDCACALPVPRHFLATWRRPSTFSVASPPTHAGLRCQWCGLPLAWATACATACTTARACLSCVAPRALARPSVAMWRAGDASVSDGSQPCTPSAHQRASEISTAHASPPATPRRVRPSRAAGRNVIVASGAPSLGRTPTGVEWPYDCEAQPRDTSHHTLCTSSCRKLVSCGGVRACRHAFRAQKLHEA